MREYEAIVIGGGSAGLAASVALHNEGVTDILLLERDQELGGILNQCIHNGFGLKVFKEELTGPEYAERYKDIFVEKNIPYKTNTMVISCDKNRIVEYANKDEGFVKIKGKAIIMTTGCYERNAGAIQLPGDRPSGIITAGTAQKYLNMDGYLVGKKVFILGSGDIGLIMARRMTLEGAEVLGVAEIMPYSGGLNRNIVQCLDDYNIPLYLNHTITSIKGKDHIEQIVLQEVKDFIPIKGTEKTFDVDTLLLSIGLIPEQSLAEKAGIILHSKTKGPMVDESYQTNIDGIFACGNALHVHDLVDFVSTESERAGKAAAQYIKRSDKNVGLSVNTIANKGISYIVPQTIHPKSIEQNLELFLRVDGVYQDMDLVIKSGDKEIKRYKKRHLAPAEMERIIIPKQWLVDINHDLEISLEAMK
ncbi:MAG: NAD(P)/FAD-dependent oxidoreductase [Candidatus Izemoplasmataceae bacterium]